MRFFCNHCDARITTKHYWEGLSIICPNCGQSTRLKYRAGQSIPGIGCSITFIDFEQLLTEKAYSEVMDPLVEKLLGCSIERTETGVKLVEDDGSFIPLEVAHVELQLDPEAQGQIYNAAMSMWR